MNERRGLVGNNARAGASHPDLSRIDGAYPPYLWASLFRVALAESLLSDTLPHIQEYAATAATKGASSLVG